MNTWRQAIDNLSCQPPPIRKWDDPLPPVMKNCIVCSRPFLATGSGVKLYCSDKCRSVMTARKQQIKREELRALAPSLDSAREASGGVGV